jgi:hypothetical protein
MGLFRRTPELLDRQRRALDQAGEVQPVSRWRRWLASDTGYLAILVAGSWLVVWQAERSGISSRTADLVGVAIGIGLFVATWPAWSRLRRRMLRLPPPPPRVEVTDEQVKAMMRDLEERGDSDPHTSHGMSISGSFGGGQSHVETRSYSGSPAADEDAETYSGSLGGLLVYLARRLVLGRGSEER